jgi:hypothetical protein
LARFAALADWTRLNCGGMAPLPQTVVCEGPTRLQAHDEEFLGTEAARATTARYRHRRPALACGR